MANFVSKMQVDTVIIGSGICGLSVAHFLSKKNKSFVVIEAQNKVGGIIKSQHQNEFICEYGPNTVLLNNDAIVELIKDCGLWDEIIYPSKISDKNRYVIHREELVAVPTTIWGFLRTPIISFRSKLRLICEPFISKSSTNLTVYDFISKRFGKEFHDKLIEPFLTGIYAGDTKSMSAKHVLKKIWNLEQEYGSVIKGIFKLSSSKSKSAQTSFSFPKGLTQLTASIEKNIKQHLKLNTTVKNVVKSENGFHVNCGSENFSCKNIISTIPSYSLKEIINHTKLIKELNKIIYSPIVVFHFAFYKQNIKNSLDGFGVLTKPADAKSFLGVLFNSQIFHHVSPQNMELFTVLVGGERQSNLCSLSLNKLESLVLAELEDMIGHKGELLLSTNYKWEKGIPQYQMTQDKLLEAISTFEKENLGFYVLGNYFDGISVSDCVKKAKMLTDRL